MSYGRNNSDDCQPVHLVYNFDYDAVESVTGFDQAEVMALINDYDNKMDEIRALGYLDLSYMLAEAIANIVSEVYFDGRHQQIPSTDYFALFSDMSSNEEDQYEGIDEMVTKASNICFRIHNIFVIGFSAHLDYNERSYLANVMNNHEEIAYQNGTDKMIELTEDSLIITCGIPRDLDEDEHALQQLHANIVARINRKLSGVSQRSGRH